MIAAIPPLAERNYFELFGLPVAFALDVETLAARYRELAREAHPDRFAVGSDSERRLAMQWTTLLNEAFRVLKSPVSRAAYLLQLKHVSLPAGTVAAVDPAFLMQQMELRERLDDVRGDADEMESLVRDIRELLDQREASLREHLAPASWKPEQAYRVVQEMQFLDKLQQQVADFDEADLS